VLRARGVRVLYDEPRRGTEGSRINFLHPKDCGGVLVELVEPTGDTRAVEGARERRRE
jgi:methylmalonyl-CoA/ethylmalonyl-CoA epimerase